MRSNLTLFLILGLLFTAAYYALPPLGLYANDGGVKFIQMKSFYNSHWQKLGIDYPGKKIGLDLSYLNPKKYLRERGGKLYSSYPPLFTFLTSLAYPLLGNRVIRFLPLLSLFLALIFFAKTISFFMEKKFTYYAFLSFFVFGSPLYVFSITFWEHLPAVLLLTASLYFFTSYFYKGKRIRDLILCGFILSTSVFFRTEMFLLVVSFAGSLSISFIINNKLKHLKYASISLITPIAALIIFNYFAYGNPIGFHATSHLPKIINLKNRLFYTGLLIIAYLSFWFILKYFKPKNFQRLYVLSATLLIIGIFTFFESSPAPNLFRCFPLIFVLIMLTEKDAEDFFKGRLKLSSILLLTLTTYIALMAIAFEYMADTSVRYVLPAVTLSFILIGLNFNKVKSDKRIFGFLILMLMLSVFVNLKELTNNYLHYINFNNKRVLFLKEHTDKNDVVIFNSAPLMHHCGPLYFERIFVVRSKKQNPLELINKIRSKGVKRAYFWIINSYKLRSDLINEGYKFEESTLKIPGFSFSHHLFKIDF